jgi:hypothetical protein
MLQEAVLLIQEPVSIRFVSKGQGWGSDSELWPNSALHRTRKQRTLQSGPEHPVTVDRRITPPTAASERSMIVSCHAAPQCADAYHAYQPGDTPCVPGFSRHGNVHVRLGGCYNVSSVGLH